MLLTIYNTLLSLFLYVEPRGRLFFDNSDIGLPSGEEVGIGVLISLIALGVGQIFLHSGKGSNGENSGCGCIGVILSGIGIVSLLPLLFWICSILSVVVGFGYIIIAVLAIIVIIYSVLNKK